MEAPKMEPTGDELLSSQIMAANPQVSDRDTATTGPQKRKSAFSEGRLIKEMGESSGDQADLHNKKQLFACPYLKVSGEPNFPSCVKGFPVLSRLRQVRSAFLCYLRSCL
jgi:hypothetical protein